MMPPHLLDLPFEVIRMVTSYLDPYSWIIFYSLMLKLEIYYEIPKCMGLDLFKQAGIYRTTYQPPKVWKDLLDWIKSDSGPSPAEATRKYRRYMRVKVLHWEAYMNRTSNLPFNGLMKKVDSVLFLIHYCSSTEGLLKREHIVYLESLLITRILAEFSVNMTWNNEDQYEGPRSPPTGHQDVCVCAKLFSYPREALRVEYDGRFYMIDVEGYLLCLRIGNLASRNHQWANNNSDTISTPQVKFIEGILYKEKGEKLGTSIELLETPASVSLCDHRRLLNFRQTILLNKLSSAILSTAPPPLVTPELEDIPEKEAEAGRTLWDPVSKVLYESTARKIFPDGATIFILQEAEKEAKSQDISLSDGQSIMK